MRRRNTAGRTDAGITITFQPHEFKWLKWNLPGPSGLLGGYQRLENHIIEVTDRTTLECTLDPQRFERLVRYIQSYGSGGPNGRMRAACIPALRRIGIELQPGWRAPESKGPKASEEPSTPLGFV